MSMTISGLDDVTGKLTHLFDGIEQDMEEVGKIAGEEIVRTTLGGIAEDDQPFAAYSAAYQDMVNAVGGKPAGVVNLRGVFSHDDKRDYLKPSGRSRGSRADFQRRQLARGAGRRAFVTVTAGGRSFVAQTRQTRPALGLTDPASEMSLDLITVTTAGQTLTLTYEPREQSYMVWNHNGDGAAPARPWFSVGKQAVQSAMIKVMATCIRARVAWFNQNGTGGTIPPMGEVAAGADASTLQ